MSESLKINSCAISRLGAARQYNSDGFYMNGRFTSESHLDNIQASMEYYGDEFIFGVMDNMEVDESKERTSISTIRELRKVHEKIVVNSDDFNYKISELKSKIDEVNNLVHSLSIGKNEEFERGFSGLIISKNKFAAIGVGSCRIYLLRDGTIRHLTSDFAKTERLLKMGIITEEQVTDLSKRFGIPSGEHKIEVQISEKMDLKHGDRFLLCSDGLSDLVGDERINEIISMKGENDYLANLLISEALKNGSDDNITALLIKINRKEAAQVTSMGKQKSTGSILKPKIQLTNSRRSRINMTKFITFTLTAITSVVLISLLIFLISNLFKFSDSGSKEAGNMNGSANEAITATPSPLPETEDTNDIPEDVVKEPEKYIVQSGDNLEKISRKFYNNDPTKYKALAEYNNIPDPYVIKIGQELLIPDVSELE